MSHEFSIDACPVGDGHPAFIIGEIGLAHDGSLGTAHAYIDALAKTGATAVKFQTHIAAAESSKYEDFRVRVFPQDATRPDYWQRTSFNQSQWMELAQHAREVGLVFLSSPFSHEAVDLLMDCGTPAWKVASGEVTNLPLLKYMAQTGKPLLVSSGMSSWQELDRTIEYVRTQEAEVGIFQCTTAYPCSAEQWGLNIIPELIDRYHCPVGLSDHSGTIVPSLAATQLGASMLEFHVVFDRSQFGPDSKASLTFPEVTALVDGIRNLEVAHSSPIDKDQMAAASESNRRLFSKGLYASRDLNAGENLTEHDIHLRKPLLGISAADYEASLGRTLAKSVAQGEPIKLEDLT